VNSSRVRAAWHESGHAAVCRFLGIPIELLAIGPDGGVTKTAEPSGGDRSEEAVEKALVVALGGVLAEAYVPSLQTLGAARFERNGGDHDPYAGFLETALAASAEHPTDEDIVQTLRERLGEEAYRRCHDLAAEIVDRAEAVGRLGALADELIWRGELSGGDLEAILDAPTT